MLKKMAVTGLLSGAVALAGLAAAGGSQAAPPAGHANCVAVLTSYYGPKMQVDDAVHVLQKLAAQSGMTFGEVARMLATHSGNVETCLGYLRLS